MCAVCVGLHVCANTAEVNVGAVQLGETVGVYCKAITKMRLDFYIIHRTQRDMYLELYVLVRFAQFMC